MRQTGVLRDVFNVTVVLLFLLPKTELFAIVARLATLVVSNSKKRTFRLGGQLLPGCHIPAIRAYHNRELSATRGGYNKLAPEPAIGASTRWSGRAREPRRNRRVTTAGGISVRQCPCFRGHDRGAASLGAQLQQLLLQQQQHHSRSQQCLRMKKRCEDQDRRTRVGKYTRTMQFCARRR